ncbi:MAG TPA: hypothetical protein VM030_08805 [Acidimicrobiales bacterium]|nr:hypothetical protein [Acidimicrobiales bacterium]
MSDADREGGQVGGIEAVALGVLVLVVGSLLVANAWAVIDAKSAAGAAAREAARAYVEATDGAVAVSEGQDAADAALEGHGRDPARLQLRWSGSRFARCARVTAEARYPVPMLVLPFLRRGPAFTVAARHSEVVDPYRSDLPGKADCAPA